MPTLLWAGALRVLQTSCGAVFSAVSATVLLMACATEREAGPRAPLQFATAAVKTSPDAYAQSQSIDIESHTRGTVYRKRVKTTVKQIDFDETAPGDLKEYGYQLDDLKTAGSSAARVHQKATTRLRDLANRERLKFRLNPNRTQFLNYVLSHDLGGIRLGTVQLYFASSAHMSVKNQSAWWYHIGTLVLDDGKEWVIDLSSGFPNRPVLLSDWLRAWSRGAECAEITHEHEGFFESMRLGSRFPGTGLGGFADCYYRRAPMYYWTPKSLAAWDTRSAPNRIDFDLAEITQSCADGTVSATKSEIPANQRKDSCRIYLARVKPSAPPVSPKPAPSPAPLATQPVSRPSPTAPKPVAPAKSAPAPVAADPRGESPSTETEGDFEDDAPSAPETPTPPSEDEGDLEI